MKNFNFPQENNERRGPRSRRHHDGNSPAAEGEYTGQHGSFPSDAGHGSHHRDHHEGATPFGEKPSHNRDDGGDSRGDRAGFGPRGGGRGFGPRGGHGFGPGFGPGSGGPGFRGGFGRGGRVRKGNVRSAILSLLTQQNFNGYGLIGAIALHTDGAWRPSPGSIYPTLAALSAEGLIVSSGTGKRTEFELTEAGRTYVAEHAEEMTAVWADVNEEAGAGTDLRLSMSKLVGAVQQISLAGTEEQIKAATEALDAARRSIYKQLSD